jgi:hypothetical protein
MLWFSGHFEGSGSAIPALHGRIAVSGSSRQLLPEPDDEFLIVRFLSLIP